MSDLHAQSLLPALAATLESLPPAEPNPDRKEALDDLAGWISARLNDGQTNPVEVIFICTHNSRRSQISQAWLAALAARAGLDRIRSYSGGTEVTAFNIRAVKTLERAGFQAVIHHEMPRQSPDRTAIRYDFGSTAHVQQTLRPSRESDFRICRSNGLFGC
ncbi:MAG: hypothetical protein IPJ06_02325 [Saprospiraceae bacterium]|nr:hypothetical protein [Saprospiraceae bacterium]